MSTLLACLARHRPRWAFAAADLFGALRNRVTGRWPSVDEVATLFPDLSRRDAGRVAAKVGSQSERNEILVRCVQRVGMAPIRPLVELPAAFLALEGPCILGTFHVGALHTIGVALEALGKPVLAFRQGLLFTPRPPVELATTHGNDQQRAAAFVRALTHLQRGGFVLMALDSVPGAGIETSCLGQTLSMPRGPFALARTTGAPIVPTVVRWTPRGARVIVGEPLSFEQQASDPATMEQALANAAARWLERYLVESPSEISLGLLRELLGRTTA